MIDPSFYYSLPTAFLVTALLIPVLARLAHRIGLVDTPCSRRKHPHVTPLVGGIAIFCGFGFAVLMLDTPLSGYRALFAGCGMLLVVGVLDDFHEFSAKTRFGFQILAALTMTQWGNVVITDLGALTGGDSVPLGIFSVPFTVFCVVGVINALNMIDGLDGLAGGIVLITSLLLAWFSFGAGDTNATHLLLLLSAACAAFLGFNLSFPFRKHALVFMGDAGSMVVGYILCWFLIDFTQKPNQVFAPTTALWLLAVPLLDTVATMLGRIMHGKSPFAADRSHLHHLLLASGLSVPATLTLILISVLCMALFGIVGENMAIPEWVMSISFVVVALVYLLVTRIYSRRLFAHQP